MYEFFSSPFGLVAVGLGILAVAVLALCFWITTLDRRMRGMADGLEAERRKVAEMQMVIGRRNNAARSYGRTGGVAPAAQPVARAAAPAPAQAAPAPTAGVSVQSAPAPTAAARASQPAYPGSSSMMPPAGEVEAWVQGNAMAQQGIVIPDKKMSRKARREAERAFAARAAAELEARQARRAQEAAAVQRTAARPAPRPYGGAVTGSGYAAPTAPARPGAARAARADASAPAASTAPVVAVPAAVAAGRGRHAR